MRLFCFVEIYGFGGRRIQLRSADCQSATQQVSNLRYARYFPIRDSVFRIYVDAPCR
jgi:hypothetical protein